MIQILDQTVMINNQPVVISWTWLLDVSGDGAAWQAPEA